MIPSGNVPLAMSWAIGSQCLLAPIFACCINFSILLTYPLPTASANGIMVGSAFIFSSAFVLGGAKIFETDWVVGLYVLIGTFTIALIAAWIMRNPKKKHDIAFEGDD